MMQLLRVEFKRLFARRAVLLLLFAAFALPAAIGAAVAWEHRPASPAEIADAERQLAAERDDRWIKREARQCEKRPEQWDVEATDPAEITSECMERVGPQLDWYLWRPRLDLASHVQFDSGPAVVVVVMALLMLAGTTFAGHDWATGSVTNQLLFEPRRPRVWLAKAAAVGLVAGLVAAIVHSGYWLALRAVAHAYDAPQKPGVLLDALQFGGRAAAVTAFAAVGAYALTMFFRSTVGTLGVVAVVAIAGGVVLAAFGLESRWNPAFNIGAVLYDGLSYTVEERCTVDGGSGFEWCLEQRRLSLVDGAAYLGVLLLAAVALSLTSFRNRDV